MWIGSRSSPFEEDEGSSVAVSSRDSRFEEDEGSSVDRQ